MKKLDYNKIPDAPEYLPFNLPSDGYVCAVKAVNDNEEKQQLEFEYDVVKGKFKNFFKKRFDTNTRDNKWWEGTFAVPYDEEHAYRMKGFKTAVEKSNKGFTWDGEDESQFVKKLFGMTIREIEKLGNNGKVNTRSYVDAIHSVDIIEKGEFTLRDKKCLTDEEKETSKKGDFKDPFTDSNSSDSSTPDPFTDDDSDPFAD